MTRRGIVLAGGGGSRLRPITSAVTKQLLPVYDKPMIYYPLATLMSAGVREILIVTAPDERPRFERLLGDGSHIGLALEYAVQDEPRGIADALLVGRGFIGAAPVALVLGDNLFYGPGLAAPLVRAAARTSGATVFGYPVPDPTHYGVLELDDDGGIASLEEKPATPRSPLAVTGLYFYDAEAVGIAERLRPSARGELEITDLNRAYLERGSLAAEVLDASTTWLDMGTPDSLLAAARYVAGVTAGEGSSPGCLEAIAFSAGWIDREQLGAAAARAGGSEYGRRLSALAEERGA